MLPLYSDEKALIRILKKISRGEAGKEESEWITKRYGAARDRLVLRRVLTRTPLNDGFSRYGPGPLWNAALKVLEL